MNDTIYVKHTHIVNIYIWKPGKPGNHQGEEGKEGKEGRRQAEIEF